MNDDIGMAFERRTVAAAPAARADAGWQEGATQDLRGAEYQQEAVSA
jgi:hypothetical protein